MASKANIAVTTTFFPASLAADCIRDAPFVTDFTKRAEQCRFAKKTLGTHRRKQGGKCEKSLPQANICGRLDGSKGFAAALGC